MNFSFEGPAQWLGTEGMYILYCIVIIFCLVMAHQRAVIRAIGGLLFLGFLSIWMIGPEKIGQLGQQLGQLFGI